jgi:membrane protein DedA with SNARE-associated domain
VDFIRALAHVILQFYSAHKFGGLFFLVLIEEAGIPIPVPGDALVMIAGLSAERAPLYTVQVLAVASAAVFLGSSMLYFVVRRGGRALLKKYGGLLRLNEQRLARMEVWFARRGRAAIIFGRLIPGLRLPTTILAGLSGIPYRVYAPTAAVAAVVWSAVFYFLGVVVQHEARYVAAIVVGLLDTLTDSLLWVWVLLALLGMAAGALHLTQRRREKRRTSSRRRPPTHPSPESEPGSSDGSRPGNPTPAE